jgi:hypothetical protein
MALDTRIKKLEEQLTPPEVFISLSRYACESDDDIARRVEQALGRRRGPQDVLFVVELEKFGVECPEGPHVHPEDAKVWNGEARR